MNVFSPFSDIASLAEAMPQLAWSTDAFGSSDYFNTRWVEYTGMPMSALVGAGWLDAVHPEDRERTGAAWFDAVAGKRSYDVEYRLRRADGAYRWMIARGVPARADDGAIVRWYGTTTDVHDQRERLRAALQDHDTLAAIAECIPQFVFSSTPDGMIDYYNGRLAEYTERSQAELLGTGWHDFVHPDDIERTSQAWFGAIRSGRPYEEQLRMRRRSDGTYRWHLNRASAIRDENGTILRWFGTCTDIDDQKRTAERVAFLAGIGEALSASLALEELLQVLVAACVPGLADRALVYLAAENEPPRLAAQRARDGAPPDVAPARGVTSEADDETTLVAPLRVQGRQLGTLVLRSEAPSARRFGPADRRLAEEVAVRAAVSLDHALRYEREHRVSERFQTASLPRTLPALPGITLSARYAAGRAEAQIGGDWYDALALPDGRLVVTIGDVAGNGIEAAVTMAIVRQSLRAVAAVNPDPIMMLDAAERTLRSDHPDAIVTAFVGVYDPIAGAISFASAGHPPPLLRAPRGTVRELSAPDLPLGLRGGDRGRAAHADVPAGSTLVFYTDGLVEATRDIAVGEARLRDALERTLATPPERWADAIYAAVLPEGARDDVAILTVAIAPQRTGLLRRRLDADDETAAREVQAEIAAALDGCGFAEGDIDVALMVFAEMLGNVVRYAPGRCDVVLDTAAAMPVLHLLDRGPGFRFVPRLPVDVMSERGRGLYLLGTTCPEFHVDERPGGGSHARAVLPRFNRPR